MGNIKNWTIFFFLLICPSLITAQIKRSSSFKKKYTLKEVVVLSRHNIRSPLSTNGSTLSQLTPHPWIEWSSAPSELTLRGGVLETMMGQFFRKWLISAGMFTDNCIPEADEVNLYANSMQRTIATAQYFSSGFMPVANLTVHHKFAPSKMDPVFFPGLTKISDAYSKETLEQAAALNSPEIQNQLSDSYKLIEKILNLQDSPAYKAGQISSFNPKDTKIILNLGAEPNMEGSLKIATSASDALILQYYEEPDAKKAAFNHNITDKDWEKIAFIKDVYGDLLFTTPNVAYNVAHPQLLCISEELQKENRKFTYLCGHDSNIGSVCAALEVENYSLPHSIEKKTPIGGKLVFEKWTDQKGNEYIAINMVYQTTRQIRELKMMDENNPPMIFPLKIKGLKANSDNLYLFSDFQSRLAKAITAYDLLK